VDFSLFNLREMNHQQKMQPSYSPTEHETKFVFNNSSSHIIVQWLERRCLRDPKFPQGIVSSLYYDTKDWRFLRDKINSDFLKTKVRVRWYADMDTGDPKGFSFLETKNKIGRRRFKFRTNTGIPASWFSEVDLSNGKLLDIPHLLKSHGIVIHGTLFPAFQINYKRKRFIDPVTGLRLCVDYDINTPRVNGFLLPRSNPFMLRNAVFEMKGRISELPEVLHQLTALGCRKRSFSKYISCYHKIMRRDAY
jgi:hypothetical protein